MENSSTLSDDLRRYLALIWHWAWLLVLATVIASTVAYFISRQMQPVYQASTLILINEAPGNKATDYSSILTSERLTRTYAQVMTTSPVLEGVRQELGLNLSIQALVRMINVQPVRDTQLIRISVEDTDPERAANIANTLVTEFSAQNQAEQTLRFSASKENMEAELARLSELILETQVSLAALPAERSASERLNLEASLTQYRYSYTALLQSYEQVRLAEAQSMASVVQKEPASLPLNPIRPRPLQNAVLAGFVGLILAAGVVFLREALDNTLKTPEDIQRYLGLPVIGMIGEMKRLKSKEASVYVAENPRSPISEAFRTLRTNLDFAGVDHPIHSLLITSSAPSEGKSTIASNLAVVMAQGERKVILMDTDLRRPNVHHYMNVPNRLGLTDLFRANADERIRLEQVVIQWGDYSLGIIPSGTLPPNPAELLGSKRMAQLLDGLKSRADMVIIDGPPFIVADPIVLSAKVDGVLMVVEPGGTRIEAARAMVEQLQRAGARVIGVVLNPISRKSLGYSGRYDYYARDNDYFRDRDGKQSRAKESEPRENARQPTPFLQRVKKL
jgi:capsular exopolysaccharide synthesis family protein